MRVLIGCEHSGVVRNAFRDRGHDAWSCDLLPAKDGSRFHLQCNVFSILMDGWDLAIFHPDCTYLTSSAEWAFKEPPYHQRVKPGTLTGKARWEARRDAAENALHMWNAPIDRIAIENPVGYLSNVLGRPSQIVQPYKFGDDASKATCFWLRNLNPLMPNVPRINPRAVGKRPRWGNQTDNGQNKLSPSDDRWALRSQTYPGIARAMAEQWGDPAPQTLLSMISKAGCNTHTSEEENHG